MTDTEKINKISNRIKILGLKHNHVAKRVDITNVELSHYLNHRRRMPIEIYTKLTAYLGM